METYAHDQSDEMEMNVAYLLHTPPTANSNQKFPASYCTVITSLTVTDTNSIINNSLELSEWNISLMTDEWQKSKQYIDQNLSQHGNLWLWHHCFYIDASLST